MPRPAQLQQLPATFRRTDTFPPPDTQYAKLGAYVLRYVDKIDNPISLISGAEGVIPFSSPWMVVDIS
eukprot:scaffold376_cov156-Amphora_coffeaeformis.AAC.11